MGSVYLWLLLIFFISAILIGLLQDHSTLAQLPDLAAEKCFPTRFFGDCEWGLPPLVWHWCRNNLNNSAAPSSYLKLQIILKYFFKNRLQNANSILFWDYLCTCSWKWHVCDLQTWNTKSEISYLLVRFKKCLFSHSKRKAIRPLLVFLGELKITFIREIYFLPTLRGLEIFRLYLNTVLWWWLFQGRAPFFW